MAQPSRAQEIAGGIKNALNRGEPLAKAKQSFINAGYTNSEVKEATSMITSDLGTAKKLPENPAAKPKSSKTLIIILSIIGTLLVASALALTVFWDKVYPFVEKLLA